MNIIWVRGTGLGEAFDKGVIIWTQTGESISNEEEVSTLVITEVAFIFSSSPFVSSSGFW